MTGTREQHEFIKMRLRLAGSSLACIARELGIQPTTVTATSQGKRRSRRIEQAIARKLGCTPQSLWPGRYVEASAEGDPP
ncbi:helix-turn-helix domain-containing protein [Pseudoxanthomonas mexicana]|uniref:Helix-turn-helix domain-containing protein n=2 Tax=Pseudoxanthomonas mexicana TaxID=128785 RepID=A0ABX6R9N0_PSEMX|nr:helix-turn-helix domain-containing protein [Pseudoxanthomonas mexicana]